MTLIIYPVNKGLVNQMKDDFVACTHAKLYFLENYKNSFSGSTCGRPC